MEKPMEPQENDFENIKYMTHEFGPDGEMRQTIVYHNEEIKIGHKVKSDPKNELTAFENP